VPSLTDGYLPFLFANELLALLRGPADDVAGIGADAGCPVVLA
jgi:hypothetical protein